MKALSAKLTAFLTSMMMLTPHTLAATYSLSDNTSLIKGCQGTIDILIDTEGENVIAGDSTIFINNNDVTVSKLTIGTPMPMQTFNQINPGELKLSGARLPLTGAFNGSGVLGHITFTPNVASNSGSFTFSSNLVADNLIVNESIENVITGVASKTYSFANRYNVEVDGIGFCTPDAGAPTVQFITPPASSSNNPVDTNITFSVSDNRTGIDLNSVNFTIDGISYDQNSAEVTVTPDAGGVYRFETNPVNDFNEGQSVAISVNACDNNSPQNCKTTNTTFNIFQPTPPPPVCGNGIIESGEQCDDGNNISADGCSSICLSEIIITQEASCTNGIHDSNEAGIDCGGVCGNACASCVDGILNQGETGVDCGGPCPSCDLACALPGENNYDNVAQAQTEEPIHAAAEEENYVTVCHYPTEDPTQPYNLEVTEGNLQEHLNHGDTEGACAIEEGLLVDQTQNGNAIMAIFTPEEEIVEEPLPQEYSLNITSNDCNTDAPFESVEILEPENNIVSSDLRPEISGSVTQNTKTVTIWRTRLNSEGSSIAGEREAIGTISNFGDYPTVDQCDNIIAYKNFSLRDYAAFEDQSKYLIEAEASFEPVDENERTIISATNVTFDNEIFAEAPTQLSLDGEPIPEDAISTDEFGNQVVYLDQSWIPEAYAESGSRAFDIYNAQPEISGLTENDAKVFAVWNSVVLHSDADADQSEGTFSITAPRALERNEAHRVTLYAVKTDLRGNKVRSPSVTAHFFVAERTLPLYVILSGITLMGILSIGGIILRHRLKHGSALTFLGKSEKMNKAKSISKRLLK